MKCKPILCTNPVFFWRGEQNSECRGCPHAHPSWAVKLMIKSFSSSEGASSPKRTVMFPLARQEIWSFAFNFQPVGLPGCPVRCPPHPQIRLFLCISVPSSTMAHPSALHEHPWIRGLPTSFYFLGPLQTCPLHTAGMARHISHFRAADNFCRDPNLSRVLFFAPQRCHTTKHHSPNWSSNDPILSKFICFLRCSGRSIAACFLAADRQLILTAHWRYLAGCRPFFMGLQSFRGGFHMAIYVLF
jgi:hypothetical protein